MRDEIEDKKLALVRALILQQINELAESLQARRGNLLEVRREMWKEARLLIRDFDDVADLSLYAEEVAKNERQYVETSERLSRLKKMLDSPYFARIDFIEDGYDDLEEVYIGRHSLFDEKAYAYHVYDWRAPISSLYYDHGVGVASFQGPGGIVSGEIRLKRQYHIEKGELVYLFDTDLTIGDEILQFELSKASNAKIKTIINTIQKDQNKAIRCEADHVFIYGPAGSGKTSVGLHRLAYLLYRHRNSLNSKKVRIFSPSPIFASYIEGIIPELGEEDVQNLDFPELLTSYGSRYAFYDLYEQIEYLSNAKSNDDRRLLIAQKYSPKFADFIENFVKAYTPSFADNVFFYKDKVCDKERLAELYRDRTTTSSLTSKTKRVLAYVNQAYDEYYKENKKAITQLFESIHDETFSEGEVFRRFEEEKNIVISDLRNRLLPNSKRLYEKALRAWTRQEKLKGTGFAIQALRQDKLYFEDALALFYIDILAGRIPQDKNVKHILIDEAQDIGYLQHRILQQLFRASHFTVLADANQALYPEINLHKTSELEDIYNKATVIPLTKSYRSTYEISRFALNILEPKSNQPQETILSDDTLFVRHGEEPAIIKTNDPIKATLELIQNLPESYNTIGILLSRVKQAKSFYAQLKEVYQQDNSPRPLTLIADAKGNFLPGVMVMAVPFAKGLEFDAVICPEYGLEVFQGHMGRKLLYLICTRALHRLYLLA